MLRYHQAKILTVPKKIQESFSLEALLYTAKPSFAQMSKLLCQLLQSEVNDFRIKFLICDVPFSKTIPDQAHQSNFKFKEINRTETLISGYLSGTYGREKNSIDGSFFATRHEEYKNIWMLVTDAPSLFVRNPLKYFIQASHPRSSVPVLKTRQMEELMGMFAESNMDSYQVRVKQIGHRSVNKSKGASKNLETERVWTDITLEEAFLITKSPKHWITDLTIQSLFGHTRLGTIKFTRNGEFVLRGLHSPNTLNNLFQLTAKASQERYLFLNNRARTKENDFTSKAFEIDFGTAIFKSKDDFQKLKIALKQVPALNITPLHGNPYYHASLVDYSDGSIYEILIGESNKIVVFPQGRTSVRALQRFCSKVFMTFQEGELKDFNYAIR